jgi:hypothetical protein
MIGELRTVICELDNSGSSLVYVYVYLVYAFRFGVKVCR